MTQEVQQRCVWSLIRCLKNTRSWTPALPDRISQGWKVIPLENYVIFRHHDRQNYVARVIKQECPPAWWVQAPDWLFSLNQKGCCEIFANLKFSWVKFSPLATVARLNFSLELNAVLSICSSVLMNAPGRFGVTDVFPCFFVRTQMNSDGELSRISVDTATLTQDVSMSPIRLGFYLLDSIKTGRYVTIDSRALLKSKPPLLGKYPRGLIRALQQIASYESGGLSVFLPRRWAPIYELLTWMKQGFKTE